MLSITNMTSEQASHYHKEEQNYYQKNNEIGIWQGKGAESLNLQGNISHEQFDRLCHGINPITDEVLVDSSKRAGTDLTFSAPKSVSILMELSSNDEELKIRAAHDKAVEETLKFIEENYSQTREQIDRVRNTLDTGNLVIAKFQHDTSRELDPQLHTHSFVLNMTQKENGEWRALHNDELFKNKMLFGQMYRNQLAANLKELGYETEVTDAKKGLFEVKGISDELMTEFSKRSEQVQKRFEELKKKYPNMEDTKLKEMATLDSRKSKDKTLDRTQIRAENLKRAEAIQDISNLVQNCKNIKSEIKELTAKKYLDKAKDILTSKESIFTKEQLLRESMKLSLGTYTLSDFQKEILKDEELINFEKNIYSTKEMIKIEKSIIQNAKDFKNSFSEIANTQSLNNFVEENYQTMTTGQKESFTHILNSKDLICGVQGDAGTGKTFMLKAVKDFIQKSETKYELQGLSFTGKAADEIQKEANIDSTTLHSFLNQKEFKVNQIYVVDEASMVGSQQMKELIEKAKETNSKIVLIGDTKQFQTLSAGGIFEQLQKDDVMQTSIMSESKRANNDIMKSLYKDIKNKDIEKAFQTLEKEEMIKESIDLNEVKEEYLKDKDNTLLITSKNSDKNFLNEAIRNDLKSNFSNETSFEVRESINLNDTEKHFAKYYKEKELIFIQKAFKGLKAGSEAVIESINQDRNTITIKSKDKEIEIDLKKDGEKIANFQVKSKEFAVGEQVVFTKNDKKLNIKNGQIATITEIKDNEITFKRGDEELKIDSKKFNYFDYGYAISDYKSQGQTSSRVIAVANSEMANTNSLYVQVTRAKNDIKIFTDDLKKFKENSLNSQIKTSTLEYEVIDEYQKIQQEPKTINEDDMTKRTAPIKLTAEEFNTLSAKTKAELKLTDPVEILEALNIDYKKSNGKYEFKVRDEKTSSANLYIDKSGEWKYKDFGGNNGTIETLIMDKTNSTYKDALEFAIQNSKVRDYVKERLEELNGKPSQVKQSTVNLEAVKEENLKTVESKINSKVTEVKEINNYAPVVDYLASRGIIKIPPQFKIINGEYTSKEGEIKKVWGVGIETRDNKGADIHFLKPIGSLKTMALENKEISLFESQTEKATKVAIFESKMDYAAAYQQIDFSKTDVIIGNSTSNAIKVSELLKDKNYTDVMFYNQNDEPGKKFVKEIIEKAAIQKFNYIRYKNSEIKQDINDLIQNNIKLEERIQQNRQPQQEQKEEKGFVKQLLEVYEKVDDLINTADQANKLSKRDFVSDLETLQKADVESTFDFINKAINNNVNQAKQLIVSVANAVKEVAQDGQISLNGVARAILTKIKENVKEKINEREI